MAASSHSQDQTTERLNIANTQELQHFLRVIQPEFLRVVDPRESGLLDILYASKLITDTDQESLSGKDVNTRKDQARKLFFLLNKMPLDEFLSKVSPVLIKEFRHIIPDSVVTQEVVDVSTSDPDRKYCLRHDIMGRIRAASMADLLYNHGCLKFEDYEDIASGKIEADIVWAKMFAACQHEEQSAPPHLVQAVQDLLKKHKLQVPDNMAELVLRGVLCTCPGGGDDSVSFLPDSSPSLQRKVFSWVKKSPFGWRSPNSSGSSCTRVDLRSYSGATSACDHDSQSLSSEDRPTLVPDGVTSFPAQQRAISRYSRYLSTVSEEKQDLSAQPSSLSLSEKAVQPPVDSHSCHYAYGPPEKDAADQSESKKSLAIDDTSCISVDDESDLLLSKDSKSAYIPASISICCYELPFHVLQRIEYDTVSEEVDASSDVEMAASRTFQQRMKRRKYRFTPTYTSFWDMLPSSLKIFLAIFFCMSALAAFIGFYFTIFFFNPSHLTLNENSSL